MSGSYRGINNLTLLAPTTNNMTGTTVLSTTLALDIRTMPRACIVASWTGTPNGTFSVQGSVDGILFADMGITVNPAVGSADNRFIDLTETGADFVKLVYTNTSSTGTLTVKGSAKS